MQHTVKNRTYEILEKALPGDRPSRAFDIFIIALIALNVVMVILETVADLALNYGAFFELFDLFSVIVLYMTPDLSSPPGIRP